MIIDGNTTNISFTEIELEAQFRSHFVKHRSSGLQDLWADTIPRQQGDRVDVFLRHGHAQANISDPISRHAKGFYI